MLNLPTSPDDIPKSNVSVKQSLKKFHWIPKLQIYAQLIRFCEYSQTPGPDVEVAFSEFVCLTQSFCDLGKKESRHGSNLSIIQCEQKRKGKLHSTQSAYTVRAEMVSEGNYVESCVRKWNISKLPVVTSTTLSNWGLTFDFSNVARKITWSLTSDISSWKLT